VEVQNNTYVIHVPPAAYCRYAGCLILNVCIMLSEVQVRLKQRICFPLFEHLFRRISILRVTSRRGGWVRRGGCYNTLAERYGERIRCFTLTREVMPSA
jgi:hypothetical protein